MIPAPAAPCKARYLAFTSFQQWSMRGKSRNHSDSSVTCPRTTRLPYDINFPATVTLPGPFPDFKFVNPLSGKVLTAGVTMRALFGGDNWRDGNNHHHAHLHGDQHNSGSATAVSQAEFWAKSGGILRCRPLRILPAGIGGGDMRNGGGRDLRLPRRTNARPHHFHPQGGGLPVWPGGAVQFAGRYQIATFSAVRPSATTSRQEW